MRGAGVDCAQLLAAVYYEAGIIDEVPLDEYPRDWMLHRDDPRFQRTVERYARKVERAPEPGDMVLFRFGRSLAHGGIVDVCGWPWIVHAYLPEKQVTLTNLAQEKVLLKRWGGVWRPYGWE